MEGTTGMAVIGITAGVSGAELGSNNISWWCDLINGGLCGEDE